MNRIANVVVPTEIHITRIATRWWWARGEETGQVINHIGNVEGDVIVAITANELGATGRIAANGIKRSTADAKSREADADTIPGGAAEKAIAASRGHR